MKNKSKGVFILNTLKEYSSAGQYNNFNIIITLNFTTPLAKKTLSQQQQKKDLIQM